MATGPALPLTMEVEAPAGAKALRTGHHGQMHLVPPSRRCASATARTRRAAAVPAAAAFVVLTIALASTAAGAVPAPGRSVRPSAGTPAPDGTPTKAAARAAAQKINLVPADLPGWKPSANVTSAGDQAMSDRMAQCAGAQNPSVTNIADVNSPYFDHGQDEVTSSVTVVRSRADGLNDLSAMTGSKLVPCLEKIGVPYLKAQAGPGISISAVKVSPMHFGWLPPDSFAYRISLVISSQGGAGGGTVHEQLISDALGFLVRQSEVELSSTYAGPPATTKPDLSLEQKLLHLLEARAAKYAS